MLLPAAAAPDRCGSHYIQQRLGRAAVPHPRPALPGWSVLYHRQWAGVGGVGCLGCRRLYYESSQALWIYGADHQFRLSDGFDLRARAVGEDMPGNALSMVGLKRLENIQACVEAVLTDNVPGDLVECGACKGGACIFMRGLLKAAGDNRRRVYVADTFAPPVRQ